MDSISFFEPYGDMLFSLEDVNGLNRRICEGAIEEALKRYSLLVVYVERPFNNRDAVQLDLSTFNNTDVLLFDQFSCVFHADLTEANKGVHTIYKLFENYEHFCVFFADGRTSD
ncbi:hypothetical protein [Flocculibacter collagenilyticus]|uniref:hypothetical protein n=1 Tax=Flocculibacter collagenilyticus TaxID=2744479 RepID=UPI0018F690BE|nr:hypothetical protein [Flocculibacter collagenilyticus]